MLNLKPGFWYTTEGFFVFLVKHCELRYKAEILQEDGKSFQRIEVDFDGWISDEVGFLKTARVGEERFVRGTNLEWPRVLEIEDTAISHLDPLSLFPVPPQE